MLIIIRDHCFSYMTVHLVKFIKNNWLNSKSSQIVSFPNFETGTEEFAHFQTLKSLFELEYDNLLKSEYSLSLNALFLSIPKRQNVNLVLKIFNPYFT